MVPQDQLASWPLESTGTQVRSPAPTQWVQDPVLPQLWLTSGPRPGDSIHCGAAKNRNRKQRKKEERFPRGHRSGLHRAPRFPWETPSPQDLRTWLYVGIGKWGDINRGL